MMNLMTSLHPVCKKTIGLYRLYTHMLSRDLPAA